jgi:type I restriction enzyme S subunit
MNRIGHDEAVYVYPPDNAEARRTRVKTGDVLLTITGSRIGRVSAVPRELSGAHISQHVAILRPDPSQLAPGFLSYFLSTRTGGQRQIAMSQYGQTKPGLNFDQIRAFRMPSPPLQLQEEFCCRIAAMARLKEVQGHSRSTLSALFESLQYHAFRGEL